jgi:hypothetical protein
MQALQYRLSLPLFHCSGTGRASVTPATASSADYGTAWDDTLAAAEDLPPGGVLVNSADPNVEGLRR